MPQGRRKLPFSGKGKKKQLMEKRQRRVGFAVSPDERSTNTVSTHQSTVLKINTQPPTQFSKNKNRRYFLQFFDENDHEIQMKKEEAYKPMAAEKKVLELDIEDCFPHGLDFPKRPKWTYETLPASLEVQEQRYFAAWVALLETEYGRNLSYFDLNLETWRQFWRVLEISDIILYIVDIRYPAAMFPQSLHSYVCNVLKKSLILVMNKVDLVPPSLVIAWREYFKRQFPSLHVLLFTSFPGYNLRSNPKKKSGLKVVRQKGKMRMAAEGAQKLMEVCQEIVGDRVDLHSWQEKISAEMLEDFHEGEYEDVQGTAVVKVASDKTAYMKYEEYKNGVLTIGCVGQPNAGKSSLLNSLMGRKVVSVSRTPGHTKHFQTIFLTSHVKLCDCPGLVFPSTTPRKLQILMGSFPVAQLKEPFSAVKFLAEHVDLVGLLRLTHPDAEEHWSDTEESLTHPDAGQQWSAIDVCNAWAQKNGYYTARAARPDTYRAGNYLLRMAVEGKICHFSQPPEYSEKKEFWEKHKHIELVKWIQAEGKWEDSNDQDDNIVSENELEAAPEEW